MKKNEEELSGSLLRMTPLYDIKVEQDLIGVLMGFRGQEIKECAAILSGKNFRDKTMGKLFEVCRKLDEGGEDVTLMNVYTASKKEGVEITPASLSGLMTCDYSSPFRLAAIIKDSSNRNKLLRMLSAATDHALDMSYDISTIFNDIRTVIDGIGKEAENDYQKIEVPMGELMDQIVARSNGEKVDGIKSGFTIIDEKGGLQPSDLNIIAGDTSMGKTSLAMCIVKNVAESGVPCAIYSMEMSAEQMCARILSIDIDKTAAKGVSSSEILYAPMVYEQYKTVQEAYKRVHGLPIYIDVRAAHTIEGLCSSIRMLAYNAGVKVVMVDYIQLLSCKGVDDEVKSMSKIARELKVVAQETGTVVIALSQLNRVKDGASPVPNLRRLRNSGGIEQAADNIYMIYRAEYYKREYFGGWRTYPTHNTALLIRCKGRNIGLAERLLDFHPEATAYSNYSGSGAAEQPAGSSLSDDDSDKDAWYK